MKLSNGTVTVLKNFSTINQNLVIKAGNKISTMSAMKNIIAKATVEETFPREIAIYDLNEFLSALSLFEKPDLDFKCEITFTLESDMLSDVQKAAAVIGAPDMVLEGMDLGTAVIKVTDKKNTTANDYAVQVDVNSEDPDKNVPYKFWYKVENLKLLPGTYDVEVSSAKISFLKNTNVDISYFIALEPESSYDA